MCSQGCCLLVGWFAFAFLGERVLSFLYWTRKQTLLRHWDLREKMGEEIDFREKDPAVLGQQSWALSALEFSRQPPTSSSW